MKNPNGCRIFPYTPRNVIAAFSFDYFSRSFVPSIACDQAPIVCKENDGRSNGDYKQCAENGDSHNMASAHCLSLPQRIQSLLHRFQRVAYRCRTIPQDPAFKLYVGNIRRGRPAVSWLYSIMRRFALSTDASAIANRPPPTPLSSAGPSRTEKVQERGAVPRAPQDVDKV